MHAKARSQGSPDRNGSVRGRIGIRIRDLRRRRGLSQRDLQQRAGLMRCYISRLENGHTVPTLEILERLAAALDLPLYWLFHEAEEPVDDLSFGHGIEGPVQDTMWRDTRFLRKLKSLWRRMTDHDREMVMAIASRMAARVRDVAQRSRPPGTIDFLSREIPEPIQYLRDSSHGRIMPSISNSSARDF
jgi:transcriptional regulator with XRE-family HTH domain